MDQEQARDALAIIVKAVTDDLSDWALADLHNCVEADADPHGRLFRYESVALIFTEDDGMRMHPEAKAALARVVAERFGGAR